MLRKWLSLVAVFAFPISLIAADSSGAMLYTKGAAWLNGSQVPRSSAIFPGDLVQTQPDGLANINAAGTSVAVMSDSLIKFDSSSLALDHGSVSVATSKGLGAEAGGVKVLPASNSWTQFQVSDSNGKVQIVARKGNLTLTDASGTTTLAEGTSTTRDADQNSGGAAPAAGGGILDSPIVIGVGGAAIGGLLAWVLVQGSEPASKVMP
jgi:hypothetical protein